MKKRLRLVLLSLSFTLCALNLHSQWVSLGFYSTAWLKQNGYSACFNNQDYFDTTCAAVLSADTLIVSTSLNASSIPFVKYFKNLKYLDISNNSGLGVMPELPPNLRYLDCSGSYNLIGITAALPDSLRVLKFKTCNVSGIMPLPPYLEELDCSGNNLFQLPTLPATLQILDCSENAPFSLPISLPPNLKYFDCANTNATTLPPLPSGIQELYVGFNHLTTLPPLPASLRHLDFGGNQITTLSNLPDSVETVECAANLLTSLGTLSSTLKWLSCRKNNLTALPTLPSGLTVLDCSENQLTSLPVLPDSLVQFVCYTNQISTMPNLPGSLTELRCWDNNLSLLPALPNSIGHVDCSSNPITSITSFPPVMGSFRCRNTLINTLPELSDTVYSLDVVDNPYLTCLPRLKNITFLYFSYTGITCLPNYGNVDYSNPKLSTTPLCGVYDTTSCPYYWSITGRVTHDTNNNCQTDTNELALGSIPVVLKKQGSVVSTLSTRSNGTYAYEVAVIGNYEVSIDTAMLPFTVDCPDSAKYLLNITSLDSVKANTDFSLRCKAGFDLEAKSIATPTLFRPANSTQVNITTGDAANFYNAHCATGISGSVTLTYTGPVQFVSAAPNALTPTVTGNTLTYTIADFGNINFFTDFKIVMHTDTTAQIGQQVCFTLTVNPIAGDNNPANNVLTHCFTVVASYDPNDKTAYPAGDIDTAQKELTYTIRFQNTGTAEAQHIYITDTLDTDVDANTFQLLAYSHQPMVQLKENAVRFNFPNINLPDSNTNEPLSHGYVQYKVKLKPNLPLGTVINNTAYIYFDFNAPVVTNTTTNTISLVSSIQAASYEPLAFSVFPNPSNGSVTISVDGKLVSNTLTISDIMGRVIFKSEITNPKSEINAAGFGAGVYFVTVGNRTQKLIITQ